MNECTKCNFCMELKNAKGWKCTEDTRNMSAVCIQKNAYGTLQVVTQLLIELCGTLKVNSIVAKEYVERSKKYLDDIDKDMKDGDKWKEGKSPDDV